MPNTTGSERNENIYTEQSAITVGNRDEVEGKSPIFHPNEAKPMFELT